MPGKPTDRPRGKERVIGERFKVIDAALTKAERALETAVPSSHFTIDVGFALDGVRNNGWMQ